MSLQLFRTNLDAELPSDFERIPLASIRDIVLLNEVDLIYFRDLLADGGNTGNHCGENPPRLPTECINPVCWDHVADVFLVN